MESLSTRTGIGVDRTKRLLELDCSEEVFNPHPKRVLGNPPVHWTSSGSR